MHSDFCDPYQNHMSNTFNLHQYVMAKQREGYLQDYMTELDPDDPIITTETFSVQADKEYQKELQAFREK